MANVGQYDPARTVAGTREGTIMSPAFASGNRSRRRALALAGTALVGAALIVAATGISPTAANAAPPHAGCAPAAAGGSSGWCGLYPGNATANVQELGQVTVCADGQSLLIQTEDAVTGSVPDTSFACLVMTDPSQITHRLHQSLCERAGGAWFSADGGSIAINLAQDPQSLNAQFTVQVAASHSADNGNGDAFYNDVSVNTVAGGGISSS